MKRLTRTLTPALLAIAAAALTACGGDDPAKLITSAKEFLAKEDAKAAIIQVKTALQEDPNNAEARFLHGKALLLGGDPAAATIELRKALELRHPDDVVIPELARALFIEGQHQQLSEQFGKTVLSDPLAEADLKATLALSYGSLGRRDLAQRALEASLSAVPDFGPAKIFEARLQADGGDLDGALATVARQLEREPQNHEAWQLKGDLLNHGKRDPEGALAAYRQAIAAKPNLVPAHGAILTLLLARQDVAAARDQLAQLQKVLPNHPQTAFFAGNIALLDKDLEKAREITQSLLRLAPENPRVLQLAGAVEFELRSYLQAEAFLGKALQMSPGLDPSRRLLVLTYLRVSEPAKALSVLQPLLERPNPGSQVYMLKAQAHLQAGDLDDAVAAFSQAAKLDPDDTRSHTALALHKVLRGNESGLADLRNLAAKDDTITADLPLISALLKKKDFAGAMKAIDALEAKTPDKPTAANLRARVLLAQGNKAGARQSFEAALKLQPNFYPATSALAQMALQDGQPEEAKRRLDDALKADPRNMGALMAAARVKAGMGAPREEIVAMFTAAIQSNSTDAAPRLALVNYHLANQQATAALSVAQAAVAALPNNTDVLEALGRAQAASGDRNQAEASFNRLASLRPQSALPLLRLSDLHWAAGQREAAVQSLKRALAIEPENLAVQRALVDAYLATDQAATAVAVAREVQKQRPKQDVGFALEGGIEASQKRWDRALEIYARGMQAAPGSTDLATRMHVALLASEQQAAADKHAATWVREHPQDAGFQFYLGDSALARRRLAEAEVHYRNVLKLQPDNALALNNVAWLMATAKKPGAVDLARKATTLLPHRPVILDTLAFALAAESRMPEAVQVMQQALALDKGNPHLRFNLAKLHAQAGDAAAARTELDSLAALGDKFPRQAEVAALLKTL